MPSDSAEPSLLKPGPFHWFALFLLCISVCINYIDRGNLSVALSSIERDLVLNKDQLGLLGSAFFITYSLCQIAAGKLNDRYNVNWVFAAGYLAWSGATLLTGVVGSVHVAGITFSAFTMLFTLRLVLGTGESVAYPAYSKIIAGSFPESLHGAANAAIDAGSKIGPALGTLLGVELVHWLHWRGMFIAIGTVSMLWLLPWCWVAPRLKLQQQISKVRAPSYREILSKRAVWGTMIGLFGANYTWYFFLTWLPYYFEKERHFSHNRLAIFSSLPFWGVAVSSMIAGLAADAIIRRGWPAARVRQITVSLGLLGTSAFMLPAVMVRDETLSISLLMIACLSYGLFSSNHWAFTQCLAGPQAAGKWTAIENCFGNFAGVVASWLTGFILQKQHSFFMAFAVACGVLLIGVVGFWVVIGRTDRVHWSTEEIAPSAVT